MMANSNSFLSSYEIYLVSLRKRMLIDNLEKKIFFIIKMYAACTH